MHKHLRLALIAVAYILTMAFLVMAFALPTWLSVPFIACCVFLFLRGRKAELTMVLGSLLFAFGALELAVRMLQDDIFYREQEKWAVRGRFAANVRDTIAIPHGDLVAMDPTLRDALAQPRIEEFLTDNRGYRNNSNYSDETYVLLGDSFTLGTDNTQDDTLTSQLNRAYGQKFYSLGYPGDPVSYERNALRFLKTVKTPPKFVWFFFEGNDFLPEGTPVKTPRTPSALREFGRRFTVRELPLLAPRFMTMMFRSVGARIKSMLHSQAAPESPVKVYDISGLQIGFYKSYIQAATMPAAQLSMLNTPEVMERTACVFFIPDKFRVYRAWLPEDAPAPSEPAAGLVALKAHFANSHIPVVDLTPTLQTAAKTALKKDELVFWRDDTHWNAQGITAVLPAVDECLQKNH